MPLPAAAVVYADLGVRALDPITPGLIPDGALVLELPFDDVVAHTRAQYRAVLGGYRTVNGYSGYWPPGYDRVIAGIVGQRDGALERYRRQSDLYVIVPADLDPSTIQWIAKQRGAGRMSTGPDWQLYRLPELQ